MEPVELLRQDPAPRQTNDMRAADAELVEEASKAARIVDRRERLRRVRG
jgi:hypothetical protein